MTGEEAAEIVVAALKAAEEVADDGGEFAFLQEKALPEQPV